MNYNKQILDAIYNEMASIELGNYVTSVTVANLRKAKDLKSVLRSIDNFNAETERENLEKLADGFRAAWCGLSFPPLEKYLFLRVLARVRKGTKNFSVTYQPEQNEDTCGNSESDLTPYRKTTISAAGLRTCFNSLEYLDNEVSRKARRQENEKALAKAAEKLAKTLGIPAENITAEMLKSLGFTRVCKVD